MVTEANSNNDSLDSADYPFLLHVDEVIFPKIWAPFSAVVATKALKLWPFKKEEDEDSVQFIWESGNSLVDIPHPRYLCGMHLFNIDSFEQYCVYCLCVLFDKRVEECENWTAHYGITNHSTE